MLDIVSHRIYGTHDLWDTRGGWLNWCHSHIPRNSRSEQTTSINVSKVNNVHYNIIDTRDLLHRCPLYRGPLWNTEHRRQPNVDFLVIAVGTRGIDELLPVQQVRPLLDVVS